MSNGARHGLGVLAGLLLTPLLAIGFSYGVDQFNYAAQTFTPPWGAAAVMALTGVLAAFLFSSRISPVATLIGGLLFTALGLLAPLEITLGLRLLPDFVPNPLNRGLYTMVYTGIALLLGVGMLVASCFPSRWRASRRPSGTAAPYPPGGYPPPPGQGAPPAYQPQPLQHPSGPDAFQRPPGQEAFQRPFGADAPPAYRPQGETRAFERPSEEPGSLFEPQQPQGGEDTTRPMHRE
ncbi:hypothetical protein [Nonomuraea typhae]|uniref:hypothetical protein n=1 Tax=Nonomuraea typhae TaxID=2603600 RepID=UPI0012F8082F|nr:hypothetical protein [Nonomuraea typhae]